MSQHDYDAADATGAAFRADLNLLFQAIAEQNSGASEPATRFANMPWFDEANNLAKVRNEANSAWITIAEKTGTQWKPYWNTALLDAAFQAKDATLASLAAVVGVAGDILFASGADAWARLAKGSDGETLTLASGVPSWAAAAGGGLVALTAFTVSGNWTPHADATSALSFCTGGGGGAGGAGSSEGAGGGGGGATAIDFVADTTGISSETITIGSGGNGNAASASGSAGGTSSVGALASAGGGAGGTGGTGVPTSDVSGGTATVGDLLIKGGGGSGGAADLGGDGGGTFWGGGPGGGITAGANGDVYGAGGAGGDNGGDGGDGADGVILILEW